MKRTLIALSMFGLVMVTSSPVFAKNASNTNLPSKVVSFSYSTSAYTDLREKQDTSSHYIKNNSGFDLWVESLTSGNVNKTVKDMQLFRVVRKGELEIQLKRVDIHIVN